ncbi:hypothetical protein ACFPPD_09115 [Cohnella suwonensis]|uniref:Sporulation membrane protein YtrI C-terminal domain-containing protein n=1 Tax=Cohnella suwonensis TaxID=696072 RepID=A0ABW0LU91_9BACL
MRVPSFSKFRRFMQATAFFVCGAIVGAAVFNALKLDIVEQVYKENYEIRDQLETLKNDMKLAKETRKENVVRQIVTILEQSDRETGNIDILTQTELKKKLKRDLEIFVGLSIYKINTHAEFARKLLGNKVFADVGGKDYKVVIRTMLLVDGVLQVWASAEEVPHT